MAIIARENSSLRRRSGVRNAAANACSTCPPLVGRISLRTTLPPTTRRLAADPGGRPSNLPAVRGRDRRSDTGGAAPGRADLLGGGRREGVRVDVDGDSTELARAQDLHRLAP